MTSGLLKTCCQQRLGGCVLGITLAERHRKPLERKANDFAQGMVKTKV